MRRLHTFVAKLAAATFLVALGSPAVQAAPPGSQGHYDPESPAPETIAVAPAGTPEARLAELNNQFEKATAELDRLNVRLADDQRRQAQVTSALAAFARMQYEQPKPLLRLLNAGSVSQLMNDIAQDKLVAERQRALLQESKSLRVRDRKARDAASVTLGQLQSARAEAQRIADEAKAEALRAQAQALADSAAAAARARYVDSAPIRAADAPLGAAPVAGNRFGYGYCTWYVANRRPSPWLGNAGDWWPNARDYGYAEGQTPQRGAIMVTWESAYGHVAYVESVNADGSWTVSEMNFRGWNQVTTRTIRRGQVPLIGFIYGRA